ncbi:secretoglobin family 1D member 2-like [Sapajus apella]|uniref:Secretoglobin family 1D member 2-like n=1 Tax=Sapajus apella TaxID=9515 RepID=A0A6J3I705_SAPAP|nr:secretoglobin family 1D member 2-like [Sapajus apella]
MRLSVCLLLVMLSLCCYQANAVVCPAVVSDIINFFFLPDDLLKLEISKYNPPPEAVAAKFEVKKCTDQISSENRSLLQDILVIDFSFMQRHNSTHLHLRVC